MTRVIERTNRGVRLGEKHRVPREALEEVHAQVPRREVSGSIPSDDLRPGDGREQETEGAKRIVAPFRQEPKRRAAVNNPSTDRKTQRPWKGVQ
jgi:hypothetical protein